MAVYRPKYRDPKTGERIESSIWWCCFWFAGKCYRESTMTTRKTLAVEYEKNRRLEIERQYAGISTEQSAKSRIRTVTEAMKTYKAGYNVNHREKSQAWVRERSAHLERLLGNVVLLDLTETRIRQYIKDRLIEKAGNRTINMEVDCLARGVGRQWRELWPKVKRLEENHDVGVALSTEEERLLETAEANKSPLILPFIRIALLTGMRSGEIRALRVGQLDWKARTLRVGKAKSRAGTGREIPMNEDLANTLTAQVTWLKKCFDAEPRTDWHLFPFSNRIRPADPLRPATTIKTAWESVRAAAQVRCRIHDLRHTALTKMAEAGVPESTMLAIAGHMSPAMLERYSHIRLRAKREAVN
jgi:integrase